MVVADSPGISRVPGYSGAPSTGRPPSLTGLSPSVVPLSSGVQIVTSLVTVACSCRYKTRVPTTPHPQPRQGITRMWFRLIPVRSPLLGESFLLSFPRATKMFQFARLPPQYLWIQYWVTRRYPGGVSPFGHPRIIARWQLPEAYRSLPRPSSAPGAKVSTVRPL